MSRSAVISAICILLILSSANVCYADIDTSQVKSVIIYDNTFDSYIFEKSPLARIYPASITKIMTAVIVVETVADLGLKVTASEYAVSQNRAGGSTTDIQAGEELTYMQLLEALLIRSGNEVAYILAESVGGTIEAFVEMMNQKALYLGLTGTNFINPCGLHEDEHYSTAYDLLKLARYAMHNEVIAGIVSKKALSLPPTNIHTDEGWADASNTNLLLSDEGYYSDGFTVNGIKTGSTPFAGYCLMSSVTLNTGNELYGLVMGAPDEPSLYAFNKLLYEEIDSYYDDVILFGSDEVFAYLKYDDISVPLYPGEDVRVLVPPDYPVSGLDVVTVPFSDVAYPIEAYTPLGRIDIKLGEKVITSYPLVSRVDIEAETEPIESSIDITEPSENPGETEKGNDDDQAAYSSADKLLSGILIVSSSIFLLFILMSGIRSSIKKTRSKEDE